MTLDALLDDFKHVLKSDEKSESTAERYARDVRAFADWLAEHDRDIWHIEPDYEGDDNYAVSYLRNLKGDGYANTTINLRKSALSQFYQALPTIRSNPAYSLPTEAPEDLPSNPFEDWTVYNLSQRTKKSEHVTDNEQGIIHLDESEMEALCEHAPNPIGRNSLIIKLLFYCGFRRKDLAKVKYDNVDLSSRTIRFKIHKRRADSTKRNSLHAVIFPQKVKFALEQWMHVDRHAEAMADESPYLFPTERSEHINPEYINQIVRDAAESSPLDQKVLYVDKLGRKHHKYSAHSLRHSAGAYQAAQGTNQSVIQRMLAHETGEMTELYTRLKEDEYLEAVRFTEPDDE